MKTQEWQLQITETGEIFVQHFTQGSATAQDSIGFIYSSGKEIAQDYVEAAKWFRKAAEQGDVIGQDELGDRYYFGQGVAKDYDEAAKWYRKAAEQGWTDSQNNLGNCRHSGFSQHRYAGILAQTGQG